MLYDVDWNRDVCHIFLDLSSTFDVPIISCIL